jgi:hemolysin activation/secretion protein
VLTPTPPTLAKSLLLSTALSALMGVVQASDSAPVPSPPSANAKPAAAEAHFDVHEYRVLGNTVLPIRDIETVLYPLLGDHKTLADVEVARAALEKTYHERGF